ncbi:MAG: branched-chain amino acid ABC transporter permease [Thermaerobacter sp.]|nr:branched-chain amino acid ABC transporter permease [Thermaerobacter sp.]
MRLRRWIGVTGVVAGLIWPWVTGTPYMLNLATGAAIWGLFAVSYDLVIGWTGEISFGHALFFGMGVYGLGLLAVHTHWSTWILLPMATLGTGLFAMGLSFLSLRATGPYFAMVTFALAEFFHLIVQSATGFTGGTNGLAGMRFSPALTSPGVLYDVSALLALAAAFGVVRLRHHRLGLLAHAARDNPLRADLLGISSRRVKWVTLATAGALAGLAGTLYVLFQGMAFTETLNSDTSFTVLLMVIIGGVDSGWGPLAAGAGLYIVETWLNATTSHWALVLGVIYIVVVRFFPKGLAGFQRTAKLATSEQENRQWQQGGEAG